MSPLCMFRTGCLIQMQVPLTCTCSLYGLYCSSATPPALDGGEVVTAMPVVVVMTHVRMLQIVMIMVVIVKLVR